MDVFEYLPMEEDCFLILLRVRAKEFEKVVTDILSIVVLDADDQLEILVEELGIRL